MLQLGKKDGWTEKAERTEGSKGRIRQKDSTDRQNICIEHIKSTDTQESRKRPNNMKEGQEKRTKQDTLTGCTDRTNIHDRQADDL